MSGPDNQTPQVAAALFGAALAADGFRPQDITITPLVDTAYLVARWPGSDAALKPLVISGHMDVVAARREDWQRDPFAPVVANGFLYGRGATDMRLSDAMVIAALGALRHEGFRQRRDIILAFSGDQETAMKTGALLAGQLAHAELVLNVDGASGAQDERTGKPAYFAWVGTIGTTCVVTMIAGGQAQNALPQRAWANVKCRIFTGHSRKAILEELAAVVADPAVGIEDVTEGSVATAGLTHARRCGRGPGTRRARRLSRPARLCGDVDGRQLQLMVSPARRAQLWHGTAVHQGLG